MTKRTRRNHSPAFKAKVALAAITGEKTLAELAQLHDTQTFARSVVLLGGVILDRLAGAVGAMIIASHGA
jgi:hypothetical protein